MSLVNFLIPNAGRARAASLVPWQSGLLMSSWQPRSSTATPVWFWNGAVFTPVSGLSGNGYGYGSAASDGASGSFVVHYSVLPGSSGATAAVLSSGGTITPLSYSQTGVSLLGAAWVPAVSAFYALGQTGALYTPSGTALSPVTAAWSPASGAAQLVASGSCLFSILNASMIGVMTMSSVTAGTSGLVSPPLSRVFAIAASGGGLASAGYVTGSVAVTGYSWIAADPFITSNSIFVSPSTNEIALFANTDENWSFVQQVSGSGVPTFAAWAPNGVTIFVSDPVSGKISVVAYSAGSISVSTTLTLSGAGPTMFTPASNAALVCQPALNTITPYVLSGAVWTPQSTISLNNPRAILSTGASGAIAGFASGIARLTLTGSTWSISASAALPYLVQALAIDANGVIYTAGSSGPSGYTSIVSGTTVIGTTRWTGAAASIIYSQGNVAVLDPPNGLIRTFAPTAGQYTAPIQHSTVPGIPTNATQLFMGTVSILAVSPSGMPQFDWGAPYALVPARNGAISIYNGSSWSTLSFGVNHVPTAITYDPSGNISVVTLQNDFYSVSSGAALLTSGTIPLYPGQPSGTIVGISSLLWWNGLLYGASSL